MTLKKVKKLVHKHIKELQHQYCVKSLYVFGSTSREEASSKSDIDILVEFSSTEIGLFEFIKLKNFLEAVLEVKVDLVTRDAVKNWMLAQVEKEMVRVA